MTLNTLRLFGVDGRYVYPKELNDVITVVNSVTDSDLTIAGAKTFSGNVTVSGSLTASTTLDVTGAATLSSTLDVAGGASFYRNVESITGATDTLTSADSGTLFLLNRAGGIDVAIPAVAAADVGVWFDFYVQTPVSGDAYTITAQTGDLLTGRVIAWDTDTSYGTTSYAPDGSDDLIITLNATTTGGGVGGDQLRVMCIGANSWLVTGQIFHTGNTATPFS